MAFCALVCTWYLKELCFRKIFKARERKTTCWNLAVINFRCWWVYLKRACRELPSRALLATRTAWRNKSRATVHLRLNTNKILSGVVNDDVTRNRQHYARKSPRISPVTKIPVWSDCSSLSSGAAWIVWCLKLFWKTMCHAELLELLQAASVPRVILAKPWHSSTVKLNSPHIPCICGVFSETTFMFDAIELCFAFIRDKLANDCIVCPPAFKSACKSLSSR